MDVEEIIKIVALVFLAYFAFIAIVIFIIVRFPGLSTPIKIVLCRLSGFGFAGNQDIVFQDSPANCGPSCVRMVLEHFDIDYDELEVHKINNMCGTSMLDLRNVLQDFGLKSEGRHYEETFDFTKTLKDGNLALIPLRATYFFSKRNVLLIPMYLLTRLVLNRNIDVVKHWVMAESMDHEKRMLAKDPVIGNISMKYEQLEDFWNGNALIVFRKSCST